jgi:hypothetical protein
MREKKEEKCGKAEWLDEEETMLGGTVAPMV